MNEIGEVFLSGAPIRIIPAESSRDDAGRSVVP
jgi:hypothetical protein